MSRFSCLFLLTFAAACAEEDAAPAGDFDAAASAAVGTYAQIVSASYADSLEAARGIEAAVGNFVYAPSAITLTDARDAWLEAREPYLQTEVYRFYDGPIDNPVDGPEGLLNAWPLDEAFIDYVDGDADAGIINDTATTIDAPTLLALNAQGGDQNVATGYHAIEFLLWGQDASTTGPGDRPFTDYVDGGTAANQERRTDYLTTVTGMLVDDLETLDAAWNDAGENYRTEITAAAGKEGLRRILTGMTVLSGFETGGERLQTAFDSGDQEDEHSCFSDNTHRDMVQDIRGISNVWSGRYVRTDGTTVSGASVEAAVRIKSASLADQITAKIAASLALAEALQPPFDQEIEIANTAGRARVQALITSLREQANLLEQVFIALELAIPVTE
jgi:putative iron-regulated protein